VEARCLAPLAYCTRGGAITSQGGTAQSRKNRAAVLAVKQQPWGDGGICFSLFGADGGLADPARLEQTVGVRFQPTASQAPGVIQDWPKAV
jgi:hypothetical protein